MQALANALKEQPARVAVKGWLHCIFEGSFLLEAYSPEENEKHFAIAIVFENLEDELLKIVPPFVGAPFYYSDAATVIGTLHLYPEIKLVEIEKLIIHRRDADFEVVIGPKQH